MDLCHFSRLFFFLLFSSFGISGGRVCACVRGQGSKPAVFSLCLDAASVRCARDSRPRCASPFAPTGDYSGAALPVCDLYFLFFVVGKGFSSYESLSLPQF